MLNISNNKGVCQLSKLKKEVSKAMLGDVINKYLSNQKVTQEQFAESIGVTPRALRYFISGLKIPSTITLKRISTVTGVSMDELAKDIK